jgi:predicted nucleic acid-binding protein
MIVVDSCVIFDYTPIQDVILASIAIEGGYEVWTRDAHFTAIQRSLPTLKLFVEL